MREFRTVRLDHDGADLIGALALPDGPGPHPAVLVMPTAHGQGEMMRERAARLAGLGFAALAIDMYGGGRYFAVPQESGPSFAALQNAPERLRARTVAWHAALEAVPEVDAGRIGAVGYCFGGQCALELARSGADVRAVVSHHGLLTTARPAAAGMVAAHVAVFAGGRDPYASREDRDELEREMREAGARYTLTVFSEVYHGFTDPSSDASDVPGTGYDPIADKVSWAGTVALLESLLAR